MQTLSTVHASPNPHCLLTSNCLISARHVNNTIQKLFYRIDYDKSGTVLTYAAVLHYNM